jgi:hypothetical protein
MKQLVLGFLIISGFSSATFAEDMDTMDHPNRRWGVRCVARDNWGNTYDGFDRDYDDARREALRNCWQSRRNRWDDDDRDHDRDHDRDRDHRRHRCYIVRCSRR